MPQNSNFRRPGGHRLFPKNGSYGYGAKSRWAPLGAILGPMGSHWVQKMGQNVENYLAQNSNFRRPRCHRFFPKNRSYGYGVKSWWGPPRVLLGANGVQLGKKYGSKRRKLSCPKFEFSTTPRSLIFPKKWKLRLWRQITVGTSRVHLGANGVPLGKNEGSKP